MSYYGFWEWLCDNGHYLAHDCMDTKPSVCPHCSAPMRWSHSVDETNGYDESNEGTSCAGKRLIGTEDAWHLDHHGNRYATQRDLFAPNSKAWNRQRTPD
jgi:hypothetical protein